jgi:hypothetical protein
MENCLKRIVVRYKELIKYYENMEENSHSVLTQLNKPETLVYLKLLVIFIGKINELIYDMQEFCTQVSNFSNKIIELFNFFINHVLKEEHRSMTFKEKVKLIEYNEKLDIVTINDKFTKSSIEFEVYLEFVYGKNIDIISICNDKVRTELTEKFKDFIARACWKMGDTLPYCDTFLEDASALVPTDFEYAKWLRIGKRFERVMIGKYHNFTQEVDSYEKKLDTIKNLYLSILKKPQNQGVVELYQNEDMKLNYPILSNLAGTVLALPHSSVEVERLFSQLKLIKSERRCNLSEVTLESLLLLKTTDVSIVEDAKIYQSIVDKQISMRASWQS